MPNSVKKSTEVQIKLRIAANIRNIRMITGKSQSEIADKLGLTFQQIQKYERGSNRLSGSNIILLARALKCSPIDLLTMQTGEIDYRSISYEQVRPSQLKPADKDKLLSLVSSLEDMLHA